MTIKTPSRAFDSPEHPPGSTGISRRTVARGAVWAVPVASVAVAAPALAATSQNPCTPRSGTAQVQRKSKRVSSVLFADGTVASIAITQTRDNTSYDPFADAETGKVFSTDYGTAWHYVRLHHAEGMKTGDTIVMTITFPHAVSGFGFTITDIDGDAGEWIDRVSLAPESFAAVKGPHVIGAGTSSSPFLSDPQSPGNIDSADGDVTVTWPGALTTFTITYVAADTGDSEGEVNTSDIGQMIGIGKFTYDSCS